MCFLINGLASSIDGGVGLELCGRVDSAWGYDTTHHAFDIRVGYELEEEAGEVDVEGDVVGGGGGGGGGRRRTIVVVM